MNKIHVTVVALILGVSGAFGVAAATRTAGLQTTSANSGASDAAISARAHRLDKVARTSRGLDATSLRPYRPFQRRGSASQARGSCISGRLRSSSCGTTATTSPSSSRRAAMTSHVARLYSLALALFVFFLIWATIGARPWASSGTQKDPRLTALTAREQHLRRESAAVQRLVRHRWAVYRVQLHKRQSQIALRARRSWPPRPLGPRREPPTPDRHEDVVMETRRFRAMGTDIELLVDAAEAERHCRRRGGIPPARGDPFPLPPRVGALSPERGGLAGGRARAAGGRRARARGPGADPRPLRPHGPRRCRLGRIRPLVRARSGGRYGRDRRLRLRRRGPHRRHEDRAGARRPARPRRHRQGLRGTRAAQLLSPAGPALVNAGGDIAVCGGVGRWAWRRPTAT